MKERNELVKLGIDVYKNKIANGNFSKKIDALKTLREAFIDLNGGETALKFLKNMRRNGTEMFWNNWRNIRRAHPNLILS